VAGSCEYGNERLAYLLLILESVVGTVCTTGFTINNSAFFFPPQKTFVIHSVRRINSDFL
jgi:hypothetical protein